MALPIVAALVGQAIVQVATKPWPWIILAMWAASGFDWGGFAREVRSSIFGLWWLVIITILLLVVRQYLLLLTERERSNDRRR